MGRYRNKRVHLFLSDDEMSFLKERMNELNYESMNEYLRKAALQGALFEGEITKMYEGVQEVIRAFNMVDVNIFQIFRAAENYAFPDYKTDLDMINKGQDNIWRVLEKLLLKTPYKV